MSGVILFLALVLAGSAVHKALARERLSLSASRLVDGTPFIGTLALAFAGMMELMAALALMIAPLRMMGAFLAMLIWGSYALALLRRRGETLDCGCDLFSREHPVGWFAVLRPVVLAAVAMVAANLPDAGWTVDTPFVAAALLALYLAAAELAVAAPVAKRRTA